MTFSPLQPIKEMTACRKETKYKGWNKTPTNKYSEVCCCLLLGGCFRQAVMEEENTTAYHGGNRGMNFEELEKGVIVITRSFWQV